MCGVFGESEAKNVALDAYAALYAMLHRGKEGAGIVTGDGRKYKFHKGTGTVDVVFGGEGILPGLVGQYGIAHIRYSTTGEKSLDNTQPIKGLFRDKEFFIAHNGNLTHQKGLRAKIEREGFSLKTTVDTEMIAALITLSKKSDFVDAFKEAISQVTGTFSLTALYGDLVLGARDPWGNRPLIIGARDQSTMFSSETAVFDVLRAKTIREVEPGEIVVIDPSLKSDWYSIRYSPGKEGLCSFEFVYYQRPDSKLLDKRILSVREQMGKYLAQEHPVEADIVVSVPDSGNFAAIGFSQESGIPMEWGALLRDHNTGRTFIAPLGDRAKLLSLKFNVVPEKVVGRSVVLVDDSIVRATVMPKLVKNFKEAGAREIHVRISSPPYAHACWYGIDTCRVEGELVAKKHNGNVEAIRQEIGADTLGYLSLENMEKSISGNSPMGFCNACFTGNYPIPIG